MEHHPAGTLVLKHTTIIRDRLLPPHAYGQVTVDIDAQVNGMKVVAEGDMPQEARIIDVASALGISPNDTDTLNQVITVASDDRLSFDDPMAKPRRRSDRKRIPKAPADGVVNLVENGKIIFLANPEPIRVFARIAGVVVELLGDEEIRGVRIRSQGALMQCAWGNGQFTFGPYAMEPKEGLASLLEHDSLLESFRGYIYILERPIVVEDFRIVVEKQLGGLVAPCMPYYLRETAMMLKVPIILTEGFGKRKRTALLFNLLREFESSREGAFDATMPSRWEYGRPEIVLPAGLRGEAPPAPTLEDPLQVGMNVRLRRAPYEGLTGRVTDIPVSLQVIDNGLRVRAVRVKLQDDRHVTIPAANLEMLGEATRHS